MWYDAGEAEARRSPRAGAAAGTAVDGGHGAPEEAVEVPLRAAARAHGHLRPGWSGGASSLHPSSEADHAGGSGWRGDEGERLLLIHDAAHRHGDVAAPGGHGSGPVQHGGTRAGHEPWVRPPVHEQRACSSAEAVSAGVGSTRSGASGDAVAASSGTVTTKGATSSVAMTTMSSGATAEATDGLHPATEAPESTNTMVATTVATAILANQAEKKGNEAGHLTGVCLKERHPAFGWRGKSQKNLLGLEKAITLR